MKIFILNPLISKNNKSAFVSRKRQPLSLTYIASLLRDNHQIKFLDASVLNYQTEQTLAEIKKFDPEILILTSSSVDRWECPHSKIDSVFEVINQAKIKNTILTGSHGTVTPDWIFEKCEVKYIIRGEPEIIVVNLIKALKNKQEIKDIKGVSFRESDKIIHNNKAPRIEDLNKLPFPAYDLLPMDKYCYSFSDLPQPFSIMLTSRGCPFQCIYCLKAMAEGKYIARSPESVIGEIKYLIENFGVKSIFFQDWEFTIDKERVEKISDLILENKLKFKWGCNSRANSLSDQMVKEMKQAGCVRINIGFESGSQKVLDEAKKMVKIQDLEKAIKICRENKIYLGAYVLLNLPGENKDTIRETVEFLERNMIKTMIFNLAVPYFGTAIFEQLKKQNDSAKFTWDNIESYAGRINTEQSPFIAKIYLRHYKFQSKYGKLYFLNPKWYLKIISKFNV